MTEEVLTRAARGLFDKIANSLINNNDPLATSGRQDITLDIANSECNNCTINYFNYCTLISVTLLLCHN